MKYLGLFILGCSSLVSLQPIQESRYQPCRWNGDGEDQCRADKSGYDRFKCQKLDSVTGIKTGTDKKVWVKVRDGGNCTKFLSKCRCYVAPWYENACECVHPANPPEFIPFGTFRWNGSQYYDDNWWVGHNNPRRAILPGEVHANGNGNYMMKETRVAGWPKGKAPATLISDFEIIIPDDNGKTFTKYTGSDNSTICEKKRVNQGKTLSMLWNKYPWSKEKPFTMIKETKIDDRISRQVWQTITYGDDWRREWEWTMDYDRVTKYAVPVKYTFTLPDGFGGSYERKETEYKFEPIEENDESFNLSDYCSNV